MSKTGKLTARVAFPEGIARGAAMTMPRRPSPVAPIGAGLDILIDLSGRVHAVHAVRGANGPLNSATHDMLGVPITAWLNGADENGPLSAQRVLAALITSPSTDDDAFDDTRPPLLWRWRANPRGGGLSAPVRLGITPFDSDIGPGYLLQLRPLASDQVSPTEEALATEKERLTVTLDSITDAVITTDDTGRVTYLNAAAEELAGCCSSEAYGLPIEEIYHRAGAQARRQIDNPVRGVLQTGLRVSPRDAAHLNAAGQNARVIADSAAPIHDPRDGRLLGAALVFHDITDRHRASEELQKAGRIESLGLLAGGIAHDFNNLLTAILGNLSVARSAGPLPTVTVDAIERGERACCRARELTGQLLTFAKGGDPVRKTVELPALIEQAVHFALTGSSVLADCHLEPGLATVEADEGQLVQVFHNLALNAVQAMPLGGKLEVSAVNARRHPGLGSPPLPPGDYVIVTIRDHGTGIPHELLPKIFDPFFTTKPNGTGLGLATTYSILKKHDGAIAVDSQQGAGATFTIYLPANPPPIGENAAAKTPGEGRHASAKHTGGRILFMDDDPDLREMAEAILTLLGYEVIVTADGSEAIHEYENARATGCPFQAVILDLTIPGGMGGKEAVRRLREMDPAVRAVVSSGYSNDAIIADFKAAGFVGMVAKPYRMEDLAHVLSEIIAAV